MFNPFRYSLILAFTVLALVSPVRAVGPYLGSNAPNALLLLPPPPALGSVED